jgi:hypothetical protein
MPGEMLEPGLPEDRPEEDQKAGYHRNHRYGDRMDRGHLGGPCRSAVGAVLDDMVCQHLSCSETYPTTNGRESFQLDSPAFD